MSDHYDRYNGMENLLGTDLVAKRTVKGFPIDADLLMLKVEEEYGFMARDRLYEIIRTMPKYELPSAQPEIIYCGECTKMKVDSVFHDCWCSETGKKVWINHYCGYADRKEVTT